MEKQSTIRSLQRRSIVTAVSAVCLLTAMGAEAGGTVSFGDDKSITVGLGLRTSFSSVEDGAPSGASGSSDFAMDSLRLYVNGSLSKQIKATFNTEKDGSDNIKMLDGYAQFEYSDELNIWVGRMLPPSDRSNLDGPYYMSGWGYPNVSQYPAKFAGRDNGVNVWGKLLDKKLTYAVGAFEGHNNFAGASSEDDNLLYAGRVQYDFWDSSLDPAYYTSSTYFGGKNVLSVGMAAMYQKDGVGSAAAQGNYQSWNLDALLEKPLADSGTVTVEAAYYNYDTGDVADVTAGFGGSVGTDNVGGLTQGTAYLASAAYLLPKAVGPGKFQPYLRYQSFDSDLSNVTSTQQDLGVNYILNGHNARVSGTYTKNDSDVTTATDKFVVGLQLQI